MKIESLAIKAARACVWAGCALLGTALLAADPPPRQELWVPTKSWKSLLAKHPNAVMLTPEQYQALVRDAGKIKPVKDEDKLIVEALVESLRFKGDARDESSEHLKLDGEMVVRCLTDEWAEVTTRMPFRNFASVTVDGGVVLGEPVEIKGDQTAATQRKLLVKGKGAHRIQFQILGRPGTASLANTRSFAFQTTEVPAVLDLQLPPGAVVTQATASYSRDGDLAHVLLHSTTPGLRDIAWTTSSAITEEARQAVAVGATTITDHSIETEWQINIQRSTTDKSNQIAFDVVPPEAVVLSAEGEGITLWQQHGARLDVTLRDRTHVLTLRAKVQSVLDLQAKPTAQSIALPTLRFAGRLAADPQARIAEIAEGVTLMAYEGSTPSVEGWVSWNPVRDTLKLLLRKADPRVTVDADATISVTRDEVLINRTLQVHTDRPVNELRATLPAGEEFVTTASSAGPAMDWKQVGQTLEYHWPQALLSDKPATLSVKTRKRLASATGGPAVSNVKIESLAIADAKKIAGYIALDFDPTWRVSVKSAAGLEERDARITPVSGKMAWFALRDFSLAFDVQRREPVFDADITAYALPRAKTVEIEGQIVLNVSDAPMRSVKVAVTKDRAALVRFTSPLVGEQTLDAASGVWSLTLRKESMGRIPLRFRLSLPADGNATSEKEDATITIDARLPSITANGVRRSRGVWVIEANTDTELTFAQQAMQPLDVLRAPAIEGYQPRHRVVAAFDYASSEASLSLHAARHGHSELAALIVNSMRLTSVLNLDGSARHEVELSVRHSGEQFINIQLPPGSRLLTAIADGDPVKPVRGPDGAVSIPLPADSANKPSVPVRVLYESTGTTWTSRGERKLTPPTIPGDVAILGTDWQVFVPEGYHFKKVATQLEQEGTGVVVNPVSFLPGGGAYAAPRGPTVLASQPGAVRLIPADRTAILSRVRREIDVQPALSPEHVNKVQEVERGLQKANSYLDVGQYDEATKQFQNVLRLDPYNTAARRGVEKVEKTKSEYLSSARDHIRARMISQVDGKWEDSASSPQAQAVVQKLKNIRIPQINLPGVSIEEAVEFLRLKTKDLDTDGDPAHRGIGIVVKAGDIPNTSKIHLELKDVPLEEALRYVTELAGMKYTVEAGRVVIVPVTENASAMVTRVFKVPADYLQTMAANAGISAAPDPFATPTAGATQLPGKPSAKEILNNAGIQFPEGSSAVFNPVTHELVIRNTAANIAMVESSLETVVASPGQEGLLPLEIEIPEAGRRLHFHGLQAPQPLTLRYVSGDRQILHAILFMLIGAGLFLAWGRRRPVLLTLLAVLVLALGVGLITEEWQALANATLVGWLCAFFGAGLLKLAKSFDHGVMEGGQA